MNLRKIKDITGTVLTSLIIVFLLGLIFIPLYRFVGYANFLFSFFLIVLPIYLVAEIYYFIKDTSRRKAGTLRKKKKKKIITIAEWTFLALLVIIFLLAKNGSILKQECPTAIQGNPNAELTIKYFFNPFCLSCWKQEAIVEKTLDKYWNNIRLERYDYRYCHKEGQQFGLRMMPGFIFQLDNETKSFGTLTNEKMSKTICEKVKCEK